MWLTANPLTYENAMGSIQFYSGTVIEGKETIPQAGDRLYRTILDIASGTMTKVETMRYSDPLIPYTKDPVF
jgi:altronate dehydratase large subunit